MAAFVLCSRWQPTYLIWLKQIECDGGTGFGVCQCVVVAGE